MLSIEESSKELQLKRLEICKQCGLYKETPEGPICNSKLYINELDKNSISSRPKFGYKKGCGCNINKKIKFPRAKCIVLKW